jgi:hypothetical protein
LRTTTQNNFDKWRATIPAIRKTPCDHLGVEQDLHHPSAISIDCQLLTEASRFGLPERQEMQVVCPFHHKRAVAGHTRAHIGALTGRTPRTFCENSANYPAIRISLGDDLGMRSALSHPTTSWSEIRDPRRVPEIFHAGARIFPAIRMFVEDDLFMTTDLKGLRAILTPERPTRLWRTGEHRRHLKTKFFTRGTNYPAIRISLGDDLGMRSALSHSTTYPFEKLEAPAVVAFDRSVGGRRNLTRALLIFVNGGRPNGNRVMLSGMTAALRPTDRSPILKGLPEKFWQQQKFIRPFASRSGTFWL